MQVDITPIDSSFPPMRSGPFEESWNRIADIIFADAANAKLGLLNVYAPKSWTDAQWLTIRSAFPHRGHYVASGAVWISDRDPSILKSQCSRVYWVHSSSFRLPKQSTISYAVWTRRSRWWGLGVRATSLINWTSLRDRLMNQAIALFVMKHHVAARFHLDIFEGEDPVHADTVDAEYR